MTHDDPKAYLEGKGFELSKKTQVRANNFRFPCPVCGQMESCDINVKTGLWNCLRSSCEAKGNLHTLKVALGDAYSVEGVSGPANAHEEKVGSFARGLARFLGKAEGEVETLSAVDQWSKDLLTDPAASAAREYLAGRGFSLAVIKLARLGWVASPPRTADEVPAHKDGSRLQAKKAIRFQGVKDPSGEAKAVKAPSGAPGRGVNGLITIPYFDGVELALVKLRWVPPEPMDDKGRPRRYQRIADGRTVLYAPVGIDSDQVLIVGGEFDCLSVVESAIRCGNKPPSVVATSAGEGGWKDTWTTQLEGVEDLILIYDNDKGGTEGATKAAEVLGRHRVRVGQWPAPHKDANEALQAKALEGFELHAVLNAAKSPAGSRIVTLGTWTGDYLARRSSGQRLGWSTGLAELDELIGGWRPGEVTLLTGETGMGKTTAAIDFLDRQITIGRENGFKVLACPLEDGVDAYLEKFAIRDTGLQVKEISDGQFLEVASRRGNLYLLNHIGAVKPAAFKETLTYAINRLGVRFIEVDHLDFMCERGRGADEVKDQLIQTMQTAISGSPAHMLCLAQPSKSSGDKSDARVIQLADIKGRSTAVQDFANALSAWRPRTQERDQVENDDGEPDGTFMIYSLKQRHHDGKEGSVRLWFDHATEQLRTHPDSYIKPRKRR